MARDDARPDTPIELVKLTADFFEQKGIDAPRLEAEVLLAHVLNTERLGLYLNFEKPLNNSEIDRYRALVRRRAGREPTSYITGTREFWSLDFAVGPGTLIPRPDTELLVEKALELEGEALSFLELGTGTGAISVSLMTERKGWRGVGVELGPEALDFTRRNLNAHGVEERFELLEGDLFAPVQGRKFDLIISNPPYIPAGDIPELMEEVRTFEPGLALDGGEDGLDIVRRIGAEAPAHLNPGGTLLFEFGVGQGEAVENILIDTGAYSLVKLVDDLTGRPRAALAVS